MEDLHHVVWGCKRGAGMVLFCYNSKRQHGLEVPGLVPGDTAQTPSKPLQIYHVYSPTPPEGPGEPR